MNKVLLHVEGLVVFALSLWLYGHCQFSWILFIVLLFAPDLSMFGYIVNNQIGAIIYNVFHTYAVTILVVVFGVVFSAPLVMAIGLIWTAHIGMDRMLGYGLKYSTEFKDTHLNRV
ncbi:hypothetical protein J6TS1_44690 [Siminovitchia terrae]|uniref:DUF4260 family protein n=1 Tax=Siminovitchia terrae TaxID=1914933 RepID=A0A429XAL9_SIMTE|nr:DUF4260 domain-containing protein [Siminovitchia terrae]RST60485.1 DUF4260 family protein [Siminovitchia terrae]GIN91794.1 hypothetical protein J22TS1_28450 [Siminovitchia terrae]GIN98599.1 hypothetical protein J6TS1_44690 [Siminovitchia terrae]